MSDQTKSLLRSVLMALGAYLLGKNIFGTMINESVLQEVVGGVLIIGSFIAAAVNHSSTLEMFQSMIRSVTIGIGGLLVANGKIAADTLEIILGVLLAASAKVYGWLSRKKTLLLSTGKLDAGDLKGGK